MRDAPGVRPLLHLSLQYFSVSSYAEVMEGWRDEKEKVSSTFSVSRCQLHFSMQIIKHFISVWVLIKPCPQRTAFHNISACSFIYAGHVFTSLFGLLGLKRKRSFLFFSNENQDRTLSDRMWLALRQRHQPGRSARAATFCHHIRAGPTPPPKNTPRQSSHH